MRNHNWLLTKLSVTGWASNALLSSMESQSSRYGEPASNAVRPGSHLDGFRLLGFPQRRVNTVWTVACLESSALPAKGVRFNSYALLQNLYPSVSQSGRRSGLGPEGRRFKSCHSDHARVAQLAEQLLDRRQMEVRFLTRAQYGGRRQRVEPVVCGTTFSGFKSHRLPQHAVRGSWRLPLFYKEMSLGSIPRLGTNMCNDLGSIWSPKPNSSVRFVGCAQDGCIAQLVEQQTLNLKVAGSMPAMPTTCLVGLTEGHWRPKPSHAGSNPVRGTIISFPLKLTRWKRCTEDAEGSARYRGVGQWCENGR